MVFCSERRVETLMDKAAYAESDNNTATDFIALAAT